MGFRCADCDDIPKVADAGTIVDRNGASFQIMHNGLEVVAGGYHGDWMAHLIRGLKGHHEPQEEAAFQEIVRRSRHNTLIVELGAFWSYYSLWYLKQVPGSSAVAIEPDEGNLDIGRRNATHNGLVGAMTFHRATIGGEAQAEVSFLQESTNTSVVVPMVDFAAVHALAGFRHIEVLHLDTQGAETPFLRSLPENAGDLIRFVVASTHHRVISGSPSTHEDCLDALRSRGATILTEHNVQESFSGDGLIVASFAAEDLDLPFPQVSRNAPELSLFPNP
ncbi:FkbM family methyltransferase [Azorhizobium sp. AG788]|nr:FkbM family methyltransferase [Azorhizobium sp. AG788]